MSGRSSKIGTHNRLYAILDTGYCPFPRWPEVTRMLIDGGATMIEARAKGASADDLTAACRPVHAICQAAGVPLVINDELAAALALPGVGLHLGQDDMPVEAARESLGPEPILGLSTHSVEQAEAAIQKAGLLDYFAVGPVYATPTKPDYGEVGLGLVSTVSRMDPPLPFFVIGGINADRLDKVLAAGARRVVVVSHFLQAANIEETVRGLANRLP